MNCLILTLGDVPLALTQDYTAIIIINANGTMPMLAAKHAHKSSHDLGDKMNTGSDQVCR